MNSLPAASPNVSPFVSMPSRGYSVYRFAYNPNNKNSIQMGLPNQEYILKYRT